MKVAKIIPKGVDDKKRSLLEAVSYTGNGKRATQEQQSKVLQIVRQLETEYPPPVDLVSSPTKLKSGIDGTWFLQYTSPSAIGDADKFPDTWKPEYASEGTSNIETEPFTAKGTVSAAGIPVDTSERVVRQTFDVDNSRVQNDVSFDWGTIRVAGKFRPSPNVNNRAIVSFDTAEFKFGDNDDDNSKFSIDIGFVFNILKLIRGSEDNGWLEITYLDSDIRIGRGNKGTMFVLTRKQDAVKP